jgi:outer membrane protein assembly factor BamD (BamD/ComL family)
MPTDAVLMQLGRAYLAAGKKTEARQTFTRIVDEFPDSQYVPDARRELDSLKTA